MAKKFLDDGGVLYLWGKIRSAFSPITHIHGDATTSTSGFISATDKSKLDGIAQGATNVSVDSSITPGGTNPVSGGAIHTALADKVNTENGKGLSTNDYTTAEKTKLSGVEAGANNYNLPTASSDTLGGVKVGAGLAINSGVLSATGGGTADAVDWSNVQNKPDSLSDFTNDLAVQYNAAQTLSSTQKQTARENIGAGTSSFSGSYDDLSDKPTNFAPSTHNHTASQITDTIPITKGGTGATTAAAALTNLGVTATAAELNVLDGITASTAEINKLEGVTTSTTELNYVSGVTSNIQTQFTGKVSTSILGQANGVATLDGSGLVPSTQLPSYVDDIIEGYYHNNVFYSNSEHTTAITGESGKIYIDLETNLSYRYGGSTYVLITSTDMIAISNLEIDNIIALEGV